MSRYASTYKFILILMIAAVTTLRAEAQRINFVTWAGSSSISVLSSSGSNTLAFGTMFPGKTKTIALTGSDAFALEITAESGYEIMVSLNSPQVLNGPSGSTMPLKLRFAYYNQGTASLTMARAGAVEVPDGFTSVIFPIRMTTSGIPAPPPVPLDGANTSRAREKAYLFVYGSAGPSVANAASGDYSGNISITVDYYQ